MATQEGARERGTDYLRDKRQYAVLARRAMTWTFEEAVDSPEEGRALVAKYEADGTDAVLVQTVLEGDV